MFRKSLRLVAIVPLLVIPLLPGSVAAGPSPTTFSGQGLSVMFPAEAQLINLAASVPIRLRCDPIPNSSFFGAGGNAHLELTQPQGKRLAVGAADVFLFVNNLSGGGKSRTLPPTGGGGGGGFGGVICDGATWNPLTMLVTPDFQRDPLTPSLSDRSATASFAAQICTFSYFGGTCDSINTGNFTIKLVRKAPATGAGTSFTGQGMKVSFPQPGTLQGLAVSLPIQVVCNPVPSAFSSFGSGHLSVQQGQSNKVAVASSDIFWNPGAAPFGGGGGPPPQPIACDGATVNTYTLFVTPDFFTDPFTVALQKGSSTAEFAAQICGFGYYGATCDSLDTGPFTLTIGR
jgi:hypothetical protein